MANIQGILNTLAEIHGGITQQESTGFISKRAKLRKAVERHFIQTKDTPDRAALSGLCAELGLTQHDLTDAIRYTERLRKERRVYMIEYKKMMRA